MISGEEDFVDDSTSEPALEHQNAKFLYDTILKLKKQANLSQKPNLVSDELELLVPTTLITDSHPVDQWPSKATTGNNPIQWEARIRKIECGDARLDKVGLGTAGAKGGPLVSTYTLKQQKMMWATSRRVGCALERCFVKWRDFQSDNLLYEDAYRFVRNELWACYMAFSPIDTLTRLIAEHGLVKIREKYAGNAGFARLVRDCYFNELRGIEAWVFNKKAVAIMEQGSREAIKQILRGYATSMMIMVSQCKKISVPPLAEYEIGRFRFPSAGFKDGTISEIEDLAGACEVLVSGFAIVPIFKQIIDDLIHEHISAPVKGTAISSLKQTSDWRVVDMYDDIFSEPDSSLIEDFPYIRKLADGEYRRLFEDCRSPKEIARHYSLPSYRKQVLLVRRRKMDH